MSLIPSEKSVLRILEPATFSVRLPGQPCQRWSDGRHIIVAEDGYRCKCGKQFRLMELEG